MKLTLNNYGAQWDSVKSLLPSYLVDNSEGYLDVADIIDAVDEVTKKDIQDFLDKCNKFIEKKDDVKPSEQPVKPSKPKKEKKPKQSKQPKEPNPKKEPKVDNRKSVEDKSAAVKIITRFVKLHDKMVCVESKESARKILATLQKAAVNKQIRKTDEYAKEIVDIQNSLIKIIALKDGSIKIGGIEHYREIAEGYKIMRPATLIRSYIAIQGKSDVKTKAKNLLAKVDKQLMESTEQNYRTELHHIASSLRDYVNGKTDTPEMSEMALGNLYGMAGIYCKPKSGNAVNSREFLGAHFITLNFQGKWRTLIGLPESHFKMMIYGKPGSGKSTLSIQFAHYLAGMGKRVLYVADEEKYGYTLQEKIKRLNAHHANLFFVDKVLTDKGYLKQWDIIFIDSVQSAGLEVEDLERLADKLAPHASFVYVFQTTKNGQFRGENTYAHDVDTVIRVEDMIATTEKNRFGASGTVKVI